jgi:hypothetical protein
MATAAPSKNSSPTPQPPEEQFWVRYSPHGEMPLSFLGSFALHALAIGGLVLVTVYLAAFLFKPARSIPVEPVRFDDSGGTPGDKPSGPGTGVAARVEDTGTQAGKDERTQEGKDVGPTRPALTPAETTDLAVKFDPADVRYISETPTDSARAFARLNENLRNKLALSDTPPGGGKGGTGSGGGPGTGVGVGVGPGPGAGKATLSKREKRMLRWTMTFSANNGAEYVAQLRSLGAILAIPVVENPEPQYKVVRQLTRPAKMEEEDLSKIQRIYWIDDKPRSVHDVLEFLAIRLDRQPSRFVAFMPEALENSLFEMEKKEMTRRVGRYDEDRIYQTIFRVIPGPGGRYHPQLVSLELKR